MKTLNNQRGVALLVLVFLLSLAATAYVIRSLNSTVIKNDRNKKTAAALAQAKQALLAYSANQILVSINKGIPNPVTDCNLNCQRPGDLPCPDRDNDGDADPPCNGQAQRLGRLPWKTLGLGDLRDGYGERLWYAVSNRYKNNTRVPLLNSDTLGTISLRNNYGSLINDASVTTGLAAVVIAPQEVITREDGLVQNRNSINMNIASHYLDTAFGEDNANFVDGNINGFISGKVIVNGQVIVNDIILPITRNEMNAVIEPKVLAEVIKAVLIGFCSGRDKITTRTCNEPKLNDYLPDPAAITDTTCLGNGDVADTDCSTNSSLSFGRIPVGGNTSSSGSGGWETSDINSILQGISKNNWFQQNGWRELIFYARAPACAEPTKNCTGVGYLTLQSTLTPPSNNKQAILISAGSVLSGQARSSNLNKTSIANYLEYENLLPLDSVFSRYTLNANRNDRATSIP